MAQERYGFFQGTPEDPREYDSNDTATAFGALASSGVADAGTNLEVTAEGDSMRTLVGYGKAVLEGRYYVLSSDGGSVKAFTHGAEASLDRIDRIILRLDLSARTIALVKLIGTAASTPAAPALTRTSEVYELSLAQVLIHAGATEILPADITDEREDDAVCGLIAPEGLRPSAVLQMIADAVDAATDDVVRYSAQTLETAEKTQVRTNIDAQQKITANGLVKANGSGGTSAAAPGTDYAVPVTEITATLAAASWVGAAAPYTQDISVAGMLAATKGVSVGLPDTATDAEYEAAAAARLRASAKGTNYITIRAIGDKPEIDLPVLVQIKG